MEHRKRTHTPIIGITGLAGSGKSTAAQWLCDSYNWQNIKMAAPLKAMLHAAGMSKECFEGELKTVPHPMFCEQTPRYVMQTLGTEWGRQLIGQDIWVNLWGASAQQLNDKGTGVICDDVRFENEVDQILLLGGLIVKIDRPGTVDETNHSSEAVPDRFDTVIVNDGTLPDFYRSVDALYDTIDFGDLNDHFTHHDLDS
jgi:hypothetical protein